MNCLLFFVATATVALSTNDISSFSGGSLPESYSDTGTASFEIDSETTQSAEDSRDMFEFSLFQTRFRPVYENLAEWRHRFEIFRDNIAFVREHNAMRSRNFTLGINRFSDLTAQEYTDRHLSSSLLRVRGACSAYTPNSNVDSGDLRSELDWRDFDLVGPVKDQGQCGSCWAFSATACAEGAWAKHADEYIALSEQEVVDCSSNFKYHNLGCNGGNIDSAFAYQIDSGQTSEKEYPYVSGSTKKQNDQCSADSSSLVAHFSDCLDVDRNNQVDLQAAVSENGPVSVAIEADSRYFQMYESGILTSDACGTQLDHAVTVIGFGIDDGMSYWTVRNSWGKEWGEDGYFRVARTDSTNDPGVCGIASDPSFIVV